MKKFTSGKCDGSITELCKIEKSSSLLNNFIIESLCVCVCVCESVHYMCICVCVCK